MATYAQLVGLFDVDEASGLRKKVAVATLIAADKMREEAEDDTSAVAQSRKRFSQRINNTLLNEQLFLRGADDSPYAFHPIFESVYRAVIVQNRSATLAQITGASDTAIQTAVDNAIDHLAKGYPDPAAGP